MNFETFINKTTLVLKVGDLTEEDTDAIVNAANPSLLGGGGVDGAIHRKAGPKILEECKKIGHCEPGNAVITTGGNLKTKYIIHTVGPVYIDGRHNEAEILKNAYTNSLTLAKNYKIKTIAFPSISTGAYGYPANEASKVAIEAIISFLIEDTSLTEVRMVLFKPEIFEIYKEAVLLLKPGHI